MRTCGKGTKGETDESRVTQTAWFSLCFACSSFNAKALTVLWSDKIKIFADNELLQDGLELSRYEQVTWEPLPSKTAFDLLPLGAVSGLKRCIRALSAPVTTTESLILITFGCWY